MFPRKAKELKDSKRSIVISSPRLYHVERNTLVKSLVAFQIDGIEVAVLTTAENEQTEYLKNQGLFIKIVPKLSLCACIIDKLTVWYGSVNVLGYPTEEGNVIKIVDVKLASELLNVIYDCEK